MTAGYLLDTSAVLLAITLPERLSLPVRLAIESGPNSLSVVTFWEVLIKSMKGKLDVGDPRIWWAEALDQLAARALSLEANHVSEIASLASVHADPFDRALIAQATVENLALVTTDGNIQRYASDRLQVIQ